MSIVFTKQERDTIHTAWSELEKFANRTNNCLRSCDLQQLLKDEVRAYGNRLSAKAGLASCFFESHWKTLLDLYGLRPACQSARITGVAVRKNYPEEYRRLKKLADAAKEAQGAAHRRHYGT